MRHNRGLLLDTQVLLWWLAGDKSLSNQFKAQISNPKNMVYCSAVSIWEMSIKESIGKLEYPKDLLSNLKKNRIEILPITTNHVLKIQQLPVLHKDPFDRMLVAQAMAEKLNLISADKIVNQYFA